MTRLEWGTTGERFYEAGVDRGVLYPQAGDGVPWNGLVSVTEEPSGGEATPYYVDGIKYLNLAGIEEFGGTIEAYTYPDEFAECDGTAVIGNGLFIGQQRRKPFDLSYRTKIGNDIRGLDLGYKLHLIYNALASPTSKGYSTVGESIEPITFSWPFSTTPVISGPSLRPTSHVTLDSRKVRPDVLAAIEDILYGTSSTAARIPGITELISYFPTLQVTDNGDGTWTATGTDYEIAMLNETEFQIISEGAVPIDQDTYTLSSVQE